MERVFDVARITGIAPHELRPDVIPPPGEAEVSAAGAEEAA